MAKLATVRDRRRVFRGNEVPGGDENRPAATECSETECFDLRQPLCIIEAGALCPRCVIAKWELHLNAE